MQYIKLTDSSLLAETSAGYCCCSGLVLHSQAFKVTLPAQLVFLTSYNIQIKREQMNEHVKPD